MLKRPAQEAGIHCNAHSFRRGFCAHNVKIGLSTCVVHALGGWESLGMVLRYTRSVKFEGSLRHYHKVNSTY